MNKEKKVVLVLLPFWNSLIPPMGISSLKSYLKEQGCNAKAIDANVQPKFREFYDKYLTLLKQSIPPGKRGNFYNTAGTVLQKHLLAHLGQDNEDEYREAVLAIISQYYFERVGDDAIEHLISVVIKFYQYLETYLLALLEQEKPHVIGFSVYSDTLPASLFAAQVTKDYDPNIQVVIGGGIFTEDLAYGSTNFTNFLEHTPMIDNIFVGESEILFSKYLQGQLPGNQKAFTLDDVQGQTLDLDTAPIPDFSGFELEYYPNLSAYTSRSCPFQCAFCSEAFFWGKYRKKSTTRIVEELTQLYKQHSCRLFLMCDSLLNPVANGLAEALANSELSLYWDGYLRADKPVTKPDNTFKWRQGGFYRARLGLESGSDRLLQVMGKGITAQQIREALSSLAQAGIKTTTYWVIGYPGETEEDFQQTLDLVKEMKNDIYEADCNAFSFFPTGQVNSQQWAQTHQVIPLFPGKVQEKMLVQTWRLDGEPTREETYRRVNHFLSSCRELGIPNPYSLQEIHQADQRWQHLHENAVPPLLDIQSDTVEPGESKNIRQAVAGKNIDAAEAEWDFD